MAAGATMPEEDGAEEVLPVSESLRLLAVHAHPDDESSKGAAALARYAAEGVDVLVVTCTGGERGDILNPRMKKDPDVLRDMAEVRRREMAEAARVLGVRHRWLGFVDSGLPEGDPPPPLPRGCFALEPLTVAAEPLVAVVRQFRPHVVTTYDENGGYPHPDHVMCHRVTLEAFEAAPDAERYPHAGPPWQPLKLYYNGGFSRDKLQALHERTVAAGHASPLAEWLERIDAAARPDRPITTRVPCGDYFEVRDRALLAHVTQIDPDGFFFGVPMHIQLSTWPTDDFELARSLVPTELPEDDLFAGLRGQDAP